MPHTGFRMDRGSIPRISMRFPAHASRKMQVVEGHSSDPSWEVPWIDKSKVNRGVRFILESRFTVFMKEDADG